MQAQKRIAFICTLSATALTACKISKEETSDPLFDQQINNIVMRTNLTGDQLDKICGQTTLTVFVGNGEESTKDTLHAQLNAMPSPHTGTTLADDHAVTSKAFHQDFVDTISLAADSLLNNMRRLKCPKPTRSYLAILRDGPEVGVHVIAWADRAGILNRRIGHSSLREFGLRLVGSCTPEDSQALLDNSSGSTLKPSQAVFDDHERGVAVRVLTYGAPTPSDAAAMLR